MPGVFHWFYQQFTVIQSTPVFLLAILLATVLFVAVMAGLHQLSPQAKKWLTIVCTFLAGLYFLLEYFLPTKLDPQSGQAMNLLTPTIESVTQFVQFIFIWTIFLGLISLTIVHGRRLLKTQPGWHNSLAFFLAFFAMFLAGAWSRTGDAASAHPVAGRLFDTLFSGLLVNFDAAMFSLLAFYIASAAYRAFRVRTVEAALLMFSALIVMLGMVNFGVFLTHGIPLDSPYAFFRVERLSLWILNWINMPAQRAVAIGVAVGGLAMAMRIWLSLERGTFFSQES